MVRHWSSSRNRTDTYRVVASIKKADTGEPDWDCLIAGLLEHTSLSKDEILMLSVPEIEGILEGFRKNNSTEDTKGGSPDRLEDADALRFLIDNGGKL